MLSPTNDRPTSTKYFIKKDSAIDILQEVHHVLHKKKKLLWEVVYEENFNIPD